MCFAGFRTPLLSRLSVRIALQFAGKCFELYELFREGRARMTSAQGRQVGSAVWHGAKISN